MRGLSLNLKGRVNNFTLPKNQPLVPLYEAIVNSIHAIEERRKNDPTFTNGKITIEIERDTQLAIEETNVLPAIKSFIVKDNGIGFNEPNFESFMESDSTYKAEIGGKGVGRLTWLVAFEKAVIESVYQEQSEYVKRSFDFCVDNNGVDDTLENAEEFVEDNQTIVKLINCYAPYQEHLPKQAETIAMRIILHCLIYFIDKDCPQIELIDTGEKYNLNQIFSEKIKTADNRINFIVGEENFELLHVRAEDSSINGSKLYLCANSRVAVPKDLEKYVVNLSKDIFQSQGFYYIGIITGNYLDKNVDINRLSFSIPDGGIAENMVYPLSLDQIIAGATIEIEKFLSDYLTTIADSKLKQISHYATYDAPQYRHLLKLMPEAIKKIKPNLSNEKLDEELSKIKHQFDNEIKAQNKKLLDDLREGTLAYSEYQGRIGSQVEKITYANGAALAEYVAHRKVIIDLLEFAINKKEDGKFQREKFIHDLIYPMKATSDDALYNAHNLWLIDEKLAYSYYISSDIPFDNNPAEERTDILILDRPVAVAEGKNDGTEYDTITLFELKRPMRDDYTDAENPITQMYDYVDKINSGKVHDKNGRLIKTGGNTKFYLYAICDVTPKLERIIKHQGLKPTPDQIGYYRYNELYNAYIEILPFNKIINDSSKRNRIFFEKLGI